MRAVGQTCEQPHGTGSTATMGHAHTYFCLSEYQVYCLLGETFPIASSTLPVGPTSSPQCLLVAQALHAHGIFFVKHI